MRLVSSVRGVWDTGPKVAGQWYTYPMKPLTVSELASLSGKAKELATALAKFQKDDANFEAKLKGATTPTSSSLGRCSPITAERDQDTLPAGPMAGLSP